jgi:hypothetical protein
MDVWENLHTSGNLEDDAPGAAPIVKDVKNMDVWMTVGVGSATLYVEEFPLLWHEEMRGGDFHMCIALDKNDLPNRSHKRLEAKRLVFANGEQVRVHFCPRAKPCTFRHYGVFHCDDLPPAQKKNTKRRKEDQLSIVVKLIQKCERDDSDVKTAQGSARRCCERRDAEHERR